jgi:retinol dehydrogenase-12
MSRTTIVITGATSGIGRATARALAGRDVRLGLVARNPVKADDTRRAILAARPDAEVDLFIADLSLLAQVRRVARELDAALDRIDVLVNNAGIQTQGPQLTTEGIDEMLSVNALAPFLLTNLLVDKLRASAPSRVVNVASEAHRLGWSVDVGDLDHLGGYRSPGAIAAYGKTKLLDILFTFELARRLEGTGVTANCLCPGLVATDLSWHQPAITRLAYALSRTPLVRHSDQGARMSVRLAADPKLDGVSGKFFTSTTAMKPVPDMPALRDVDLQGRLWAAMEIRCGLATPSAPG